MTARGIAASASEHKKAARLKCTAEHAMYITGQAIIFPPHIRREKYSPSESGTPLAAPFKNMHAAAKMRYKNALLTFILSGIPPL